MDIFIGRLSSMYGFQCQEIPLKYVRCWCPCNHERCLLSRYEAFKKIFVRTCITRSFHVRSTFTARPLRVQLKNWLQTPTSIMANKSRIFINVQNARNATHGNAKFSILWPSAIQNNSVRLVIHEIITKVGKIRNFWQIKDQICACLFTVHKKEAELRLITKCRNEVTPKSLCSIYFNQREILITKGLINARGDANFVAEFFPSPLHLSPGELDRSDGKTLSSLFGRANARAQDWKRVSCGSTREIRRTRRVSPVCFPRPLGFRNNLGTYYRKRAL